MYMCEESVLSVLGHKRGLTWSGALGGHRNLEVMVFWLLSGTRHRQGGKGPE